MLAGEWDFEHEALYEDEDHIGYLNRYPTMPGYALVAPKAHIEHVLRGFTEDGYLRMMAVVRRVGLAVESVIGPERTYVLSLGSQQGNSHVHWHITPLPAGVPYREQQLRAVDLAHGMVDRTPAEQAALATAIRAALTPPT
jgi:diadenosine tetraphosphate (Ap4A) HIT family hydrolase